MSRTKTTHIKLKFLFYTYLLWRSYVIGQAIIHRISKTSHLRLDIILTYTIRLANDNFWQTVLLRM